MSKFYSKSDISRCYTGLIQGLMLDGNIASFTSSGTQGEEMKADFTKDGKRVFRTIIRRDIEILDTDWCERVDTLIVELLRYDNADQLHTLWNNQGKIVYQKVFYQINRGEGRIFTCDKNDIINITKLREKRYKNRRATIYGFCGVELPLTLAKPAIKLIRKRRGYKTVKVSDINRIFRETKGYMIYINEKYPVLIKSPITVTHK